MVMFGTSYITKQYLNTYIVASLRRVSTFRTKRFINDPYRQSIFGDII